MVIVSFLALIGAFWLFWLAFLIYAVGCSEESYSECTPEGVKQFLLAGVGLALALGTVVVSVLGRFRPGLWFCATALLYLVWGIYAKQVVSG